MLSSKLAGLLAKAPPRDLQREFSDYACVALIVRQSSEGHELAFIRRAHNPQDNWAGHVAFPGGRKEVHDRDDIETAIRETSEEVGWNLSKSDFLGYLSDVQARNRTGMLNFFLRPVVFQATDSWPLDQFSREEVDEVFWVSLSHLQNIDNRTSINIPSRGLDLPGIKFPSGDILWGLTYIITRELLALIEQHQLTIE